MGRSPNPGEMDMLKRKAKEMEQSDKIIPFPPGGKDKVNPFEDRPEPFNKLIDPKSDTGIKLGKVREGLKDRPNVTRDADELKPKMTETEAEMITRMNRQNKEAAARLRDKKEVEKSLQKLKDSRKPQKTLQDLLDEYDGDPDAMANGGIIGLAEGGPSDPGRRRFMKILGGLASIPVLGRFIKPVTEVAPVVAEGVKTVPSYFFKLVDKIKTLGDDAPGLTSVEREVGKRYKDYELVEDLSSGDIVVKKNKEGGTMIGDEFETGIMQEEVMIYRPRKRTPEGDIPEDYEEITARPSMPDGSMDDVEDGLDSIDDVLEEVGEIRLKKKIGGIVNVLSAFKALFKNKYTEFVAKNKRYPTNKERTKLIDDTEQEIKTNFPEEYAEFPNPSQSFRTIKGSRVDKDIEADLEREHMGFFPMTQEDEIRRVTEGGPGMTFEDLKKLGQKRQDKSGGGIAYLLGE